MCGAWTSARMGHLLRNHSSAGTWGMGHLQGSHVCDGVGVSARESLWNGTSAAAGKFGEEFSLWWQDEHSLLKLMMKRMEWWLSHHTARLILRCKNRNVSNFKEEVKCRELLKRWRLIQSQKVPQFHEV